MDVAERMEMTLGEIILAKFPGCLWAGPGSGKILGRECGGKENSLSYFFAGIDQS